MNFLFGDNTMCFVKLLIGVQLQLVKACKSISNNKIACNIVLWVKYTISKTVKMNFATLSTKGNTIPMTLSSRVANSLSF